MAGKIKFPLKMADGEAVRTIEELREHFDIVSVLDHYSSGKLLNWLESRYYDEEADRIRELDSLSDNFKRSLCEILGADYSDEEASKANIDDISKNSKRREMLKKYTADDAILSAVDRVAFTQEDLLNLVNNGISEIYLCGEMFTIPKNTKKITYKGINSPEIEIEDGRIGKNVILIDVNCKLENLLDDYYNYDKFFEDFENNSVFAVKQLSDLAQKGNEKAQMILGQCYDNGFGIEGDEREAAKWFEKAAEQGNDEAQVNLGMHYYYGWGVDKDEDEGIKWLIKSAEQNNAKAQYELGDIYLFSDDKEAIKWFKKAAEGYGTSEYRANAQYDLGRCYENGWGVPSSNIKAFEWYQKAAKNNYTPSQTRLGIFFLEGRGVKKDENKAVKWFKKAAEQGGSEAQYQLGICYLNGYGVEEDDEEAVKWFEQVAEYNNNAKCQLGICYLHGYGVEEDDEEAVKWFEEAAEYNSDAQYWLGICYYNGYGVDEDEEEAVEWFEKAAVYGHLKAELKLGYCYLNGYGVEEDDDEAVKWFQEAAEQGDSEAQNMLGRCYDEGWGVETNHEEAAEWYLKAAEQGYTAAQYNLGLCYNTWWWRCGVDPTDAISWMQKAARNGMEDAQNWLKDRDYSW